jgi:hypothetical protein
MRALLVVPLIVGLVCRSSKAFDVTRRKGSPHRQQGIRSSTLMLSTTTIRQRGVQVVRRNSNSLLAKSDEDDEDESSQSKKNFVFTALATSNDSCKPNQGNFFYNDEVISHLYGYVYLVGFFLVQDGLFMGIFFGLSSLSFLATQSSLLPPNPRVPALVALLTLSITLFLRYIIGFEPPLEMILGESYQGPTESSTMFEFIICLMNFIWGFFGTWQTKEKINGATYGF